MVAEESALHETGSAYRRLLGVSRRDFLKLTALTTAGLSLSGALGLTLTGCTQEQLEEILEKIRNRPMRRDINSLTPGDPILTAYAKAVEEMKKLDSTDPTNPRSWTRQAQIHLNFCPHGNWLFLPWHRAYLYFFEEICRQLSGNNDFALPYWNWSKDPQVPAAFWGGSSNALYDGNRSATPTSTASAAIVGPSALESILVETNFLLFASGQIPSSADQRTGASSGPLEGGPHNYIHGFVEGDMGTYLSPLDPVFWTHHNMIECIWVEWNMKRGNPNTTNSDWTGRSFTEFVDRMGNPVTVTVPEMLLWPLFVYQFDNPVKGVL